jgi:hypothetical protein
MLSTTEELFCLFASRRSIVDILFRHFLKCLALLDSSESTAAVQLDWNYESRSFRESRQVGELVFAAVKTTTIGVGQRREHFFCESVCHRKPNVLPTTANLSFRKR